MTAASMDDRVHLLHSVRKLPRSKRAMKYAGRAQLEADPFCSSTCARSYYGCPLDNGKFNEEQIEARSEYGRRGKDAGPLSRGEVAA